MRFSAAASSILALDLVAALGGCTRTPASLACADAGDGKIETRVLVYGESWAAGGRLLPEMPNRIFKRTGKAVRVCQLGFSGENSAKLLRHNPLDISYASLHGYPDAVVLLNGVNDQIQHRGAAAYAGDTLALMKLFPDARVWAVAAPIIRPDPPIPFIHRWRFKIRGLFDHESRRDYINTLVRAAPRRSIISYTAFSTGALAQPQRYATDGIHLTPAEFHAYGNFLGGNVP